MFQSSSLGFAHTDFREPALRLFWLGSGAFTNLRSDGSKSTDRL